MVRATAAASLLVCLLVVAGASASAERSRGTVARPASTVFSIVGRGWGHGIGMSQYGAYGFARRGWGYARILAHYYRGTQLGIAPVSRVRVLLAIGRTTVRIASEQPFRVRDGAGETYELEAGMYTLGRGLRLAVDGEGPRALAGPLTFSGAGAPLALDGNAYRGSFEVAVVDGRLRVVNGVGLDAYLLGVVPREVPHHWPAEALKAQAVVARSYALAVRKTGPFDLFADTRSQVYGGIAAERAETTAAVNATAGRVVLYAGRVATTYFFSTSGGRTASIHHVWNSQPVPYLVSVPDPHDAVSPHHRWGPLPVTATRLARALGARGWLLDVRAVVNGSSRIDTLTAVTPNGESSRRGDEIRTALGLRSTWFRVGMLSLDRPESAVVPYGETATIGGRARALAAVSLEARGRGEDWERLAGVKAGGDGAFAVSVKPLASTEYRLAGGTVRTGSVRLFVSPNVRLRTPTRPTELRGRVRPALPGTTVVIQRRSGAGWRSVGGATVDGRGRFSAELRLVPGTYRARVAPGKGFVPGVSPPLDVVAP